MKKFLSLVLVTFFTVSYNAFAQEEESSKPELSISGSVDAYYRANLNASNSLLTPDADGDYNTYIAPTSSFANKPGFALGMANVILGLEGKKTGFVADLVFGPRGTDAVFGSTTASSSIVNQLYAYWNVSEAVTLTIGNFNTFLGYEVISPTGNYNYSTSYMFSYGPFSHSGLKADFSFGDVTAMLAVMNPTDATDFNPSGDYVLGAQLGYGGAYLNFIYSDDFYQVDLTAGWDLTDALYLGVNATKAKDSFSGAALYLQNSFSDSFSLGLRGEYFKDEAGLAIAADESVIDLTLSANYSIGNLTLIPEFRMDMLSYDDGYILKGDQTYDANGNISGIANAELGKSLSSFTLAAVYAF
ncbi:porin [Reichenbachiella carrageenanivorans]|uniref:Porin n=1 Tax=Reichenbachiella carrageenanivorans TaxID=2979869 RepID=A0ABY6D485_9BACT|nr:porin [Reichenbachiella carrageenanivorans]UXX80724.1 porin [Reichenbachiella carrageenanivorans]